MKLFILFVGYITIIHLLSFLGERSGSLPCQVAEGDTDIFICSLDTDTRTGDAEVTSRRDMSVFYVVAAILNAGDINSVGFFAQDFNFGVSYLFA